jgi:hypothetical protein
MLLKRAIEHLKKKSKSLYARVVIPKGDYCYKLKKVVYSKELELPIFKVRKCPYWCWDKRYPSEDVGYCKYLGEGDRDDGGGGLLFDQIKECEINHFKEGESDCYE